MHKLIIALFIGSLLFISLATTGCGDKEDPFKTEGNIKKQTAAEQFQEAIKPLAAILEAAVIIEEGAVIEDTGYELVNDFKAMLAEGTSFETIAKSGYMASFEGPHLKVVPASVSPRFVELTDGLTAGQSSSILQIPEQGFGILAVTAAHDDGTIDVGVIVVPTGAPTTPTPPDGASTASD